jgi:hypothetical protein
MCTIKLLWEEFCGKIGPVGQAAAMPGKWKVESRKISDLEI